MGNRAVITTKEKEIGIYLHWNGGRDSVEAFLAYCKQKGIPSPELDNYGWARMCQVIGNFFGGNTSIGIDLFENLDWDNPDNGVYIIEDWKIIEREFSPDDEQDNYGIKKMLKDINKTQPKEEQLDLSKRRK